MNHRPPLATGLVLTLALVAGSLLSTPAAAQNGFPKIAMWAFPGAWQDSTLEFPKRCVGQFQGPLPDSVRPQARTITVRWHRDRVAEARLDFGGYRIYRVTNRYDAAGRPDTASMVLLRRYSVNPGDATLWHFSMVDSDRVSPTYLQFLCNGKVMADSVLTFVDADSSGSIQKVCRPSPTGRCIGTDGRPCACGDSIFKLIAPPGPHDGFRTWYAITYEAHNTLANDFEDLFVPDLTNCFGLPPDSCYNLNNKYTNIVSVALEPTAGPTPNLEHVAVVPNPYRATEAWDTPAGHEVHFINLPTKALIRIYTVSGDLVATLDHNDTVRDFERWDLKNQNGQDVASGIYMYRVESGSLTFQHRFIVIR